MFNHVYEKIIVCVIILNYVNRNLLYSFIIQSTYVMVMEPHKTQLISLHNN